MRSAAAEDRSTGPAPPDEDIAHWEVWAGATATASSLFVYTGATYAPWTAVTAPGWRFRIMTGYGHYTYDGTHTPAAGRPVATRFRGQKTLTEALVGYQHQHGSLTTKLFIGAQNLDGSVIPRDPGNGLQGSRIGVKAAWENWLNLTDQAWLSVDASHATAFSQTDARLRIGYNLADSLALGLEAGVHADKEVTTGRGGILVRYWSDFGEIGLSAGLAGDYDDPSAAYGGVELLTRF